MVTMPVVSVNACSDPNGLPIADAGPDQSAPEGSVVQLDGSGSSDPDGDPLTFAWSQTTGPTVLLSNADTATPELVLPAVSAETTFEFELLVTDTRGGTGTDRVLITAQNSLNDPPVADFNDPQAVKIVRLDDACRQQQVNDGCFPDFDSVPQRAITLTVPALMLGRCLICTVPGRRKGEAVHRMLTGEISVSCPASILRTHANCTMFVDNDCWSVGMK